MNKLILLAGAVILALGGCSQSDAAEGQGNVAAKANGAPAAAAMSEGRAEQTGSPALLLDANGILPGGAEESRIPFGANSLDTIEQVTPLLGETYDMNESEECGSGSMEFASWDSVSLAFRNGEFVGWNHNRASAKPRVGTPDGLTVGSPRSELAAALGGAPKVEETTLGTEFSGGGFSGLLSADTPDARVTALWAGANCVMR